MTSYRPPTTPLWLIITTLNDRRGRFDAYWPRLQELDVETPETAIIPLGSASPVRWDAQYIRREMLDQGWERAFVRTMQKAAPHRLEAGSFIQEPTVDAIDRTLESLFAQIETSPWNHGGKIALRERLDLDFCLNPGHSMCHPEIRFFIEDGEVLFPTPNRVGGESVCSQWYQHLTEVLESATLPVEDARRVARAFPELTWGVDFVLDTSGAWYCVEMNLNGVRWADELEDWINMCGHGEMESHSPRVIHDPAIAHYPKPPATADHFEP